MLRRQQLQGMVVWALAIMFVIALGARNTDISSFVQVDEVAVSDTPQKSLAIDTTAIEPASVSLPVLAWGERIDSPMGATRDGFFLGHGKTGPPMA